MLMRRKCVLMGVVALILATAALGIIEARSRQAIPSQSLTMSEHAAAESETLKGLVFAVHPTGFVPPEVTIGEGRYSFIVHNRTGLSDLTFTLDRENAARVHELRTNKRRWNGRFDLHPGRYVLSVIDHPEWRSLITVTAR